MIERSEQTVFRTGLAWRHSCDHDGTKRRRPARRSVLQAMSGQRVAAARGAFEA